MPDELAEAMGDEPGSRLMDDSIADFDGDADMDVNTFEDVSDDPIPASPPRSGLAGHLRSRAAARR